MVNPQIITWSLTNFLLSELKLTGLVKEAKMIIGIRTDKLEVLPSPPQTGEEKTDYKVNYFSLNYNYRYVNDDQTITLHNYSCAFH